MSNFKKILLALFLFSIHQIAVAQNEFITIWQTDSIGVSNDDQIIIPGIGNYNIDWEEVNNTSNNGSATAVNSDTITFPHAGTYRVKISGGLTRILFNNTGDKEKLIDIEQWGNIAWATMESAFEGCANLIHTATDAPDLSNVTRTTGMFQYCTNFNGAIGNWDVSNVTNMSRMFFLSKTFNQNIGGWAVDNVTDMIYMFRGTNYFNQNLNGWNVGSVTTMQGMFRYATAFNQNLSSWNVSNVTNMKWMFANAADFNQDLSTWDISQVTNMENMLDQSGLSVYNYDATLIAWAAQTVQPNITFGVKNLSYCAGKSARDSLSNSINNWTFINDSYDLECAFKTTWKTDNPGPSNDNQIKIPGLGTYQIYWEEIGNSTNNGDTTVTGTYTITFPNTGIYEVHLSGTLQQIKFDNGGDRQKLLSIESWGNIAWTSMNSAFEGCSNLICNATNAPYLANVSNCAETFRFCSNFDGTIGNWDVSNVTTMYEMLAYTPFNQDLSNWTLSSLSNISGLFRGATLFNQNINNWNVSNVSSMRNLFKNAQSFNQNLSAWSTGNVSNMTSLFEDAFAFDQNLGNWNISQVNQMDNMLDSSALSNINYDSTLIAWAAQAVKPNVELGALNLDYCASDSSRTKLMNIHGWMINGDQIDLGCKANFITTWKTDNIGSSNDNQITIPGSGTYYIQWEKVGDPTIKGNFNATGETTLTFPSAGIYRVGISEGLTQIQFNDGGDKEKLMTIENWGNIEWTSMNAAFKGCSNMTYNATDAPDLSGVTDCSEMFNQCLVFNGAIGNWNVSNITSMASMFKDAKDFNQDISQWNTSNVQFMGSMFMNAENFNQDISQWNTSNVQYMGFMFKNASVFNQNISNWNTGNVLKLESTFEGASAFNQSLDSWDISQVTNMIHMLDSCGMNRIQYDSTLIGWTNHAIPANLTLGAVGLEYCYAEAARDSLTISNGWTILGDHKKCSFITTWKTDNPGTSGNNQITIPGTGNYAIYWEEIGNANNQGDTIANGAITITFPNTGNYRIEISGGLSQIKFDNGGDKEKLLHIDSWGDIVWLDMDSAFEGCKNMTYTATDTIDLSVVNSCAQLFKGCTLFNGDLSTWDVSNVQLFSEMFQEAIAFNQDISNWNLNNAIVLSKMFDGATAFNQPIGNWNMSNIADLDEMFRNARSFNQDLSNWETGGVSSMRSTFENAIAFNQNLSNWDIALVTNMTSMLDSSALSEINYDSTLLAWTAQSVQPNVQLGALNLQYCESHNERTNLINNNGWTISGDQFNFDCGDFITTWKTDNGGPSNNNEITIPGTGTYDIQWEKVDSAHINGIASLSGTATLTFPNAGIYRVSISGGLTQIQFNNAGDKDKLLSIENWGNIAWTSMNSAFEGCTNMTYTATDAPDLSNVTDCAETFRFCSNFNGDIGNWEISNVTSMYEMFAYTPFNQDLSNWTLTNLVNISGLFKNATSFNQNLSAWNTGNVSNMSSLFAGASAFNQNLGNWDISQVNQMDNMLDSSALSLINYDSTLLAWAAQTIPPNLQLGAVGLVYCESQIARDSLISNHGWSITGDQIDHICGGFITTWKTDNYGPSNDNQIIIPGTGTYNIQWENVDDSTINGSLNATGAATITFPNAGTYRVSISGGLTQIRFDNGGDKNKLLTIENWGNITWTSMNSAFEGCINMTYTAIDAPDLSGVTDCSQMFRHCNIFNGAIGNWEVSTITNMSGMFQSNTNNSQFNQPLEFWDVSNVTDMSSMFSYAFLFNQNINNWTVSNVTDMSFMFEGAGDFDQPLNNWIVSNVTNMNNMFSEASDFNQPLDNWIVSNVTDMSSMFQDAKKFNQPIGNWNVSNVTNMSSMFAFAIDFNQNIANWQVHNVTNMNSMFSSAIDFNQDIASWQVHNVTNMYSMFKGTKKFNQDIGGWDVGNVVNMYHMFKGASSSNKHQFNQNLGAWNISQVATMEDMLKYTSMSIANYDSTLIGWAAQSVQPNIELGAAGLAYCEGKIARDSLVNFHGWSIGGDKLDLDCSNNFITTWQSDNTGTSNDNQITIPGTGMYFVQWEKVGSPNTKGSFNTTGTTTITFPSTGIYRVGISGGLTQIRFDNGGDKNKLLTIENWGNIAWTSMNSAFEGCINMTYTAIDAPDLSGVTDCSQMFRHCNIFNGAIGNWEVSTITNMSGMFASNTANSQFNQPLEFWDVSNVTDMSSMFSFAFLFNQNINNWTVSNVTDMSFMFEGAGDFDQPLNNWIVSNVTNMNNMFSEASDFNQPLDNWIVSNVTDMSSMFQDAKKFNQPIGNWNVSNVTNMSSMFAFAIDFNQNIANWQVHNVTNMNSMFSSAIDFNQDIASWQVHNVTNMYSMFKGTKKFNQDIGGWDVGNVVNMYHMFKGASSSNKHQFNQNLGAWNISQVATMEDMLKNTRMSIANYDSTLIGWAAQSVQPNIELGAAGLAYCEGESPRDSLIINHGWNIIGDNKDCPFITTWQTDNPGTSNNNQIIIPGSGTYKVQWEKVDSTQINGSATLTGTATLTFPSTGIYRISIFGGLTQIRFNYSGDRQKLLSIDNWGEIAWTSMNAAFSGCKNLTYNATDAPDLSLVTDCSAMFLVCAQFNGAIENWNVSNVTNMSSMFEAAYIFNQNINDWNVSNVTNMNRMFSGAEKFNGNIGSWNVSNVFDMSGMFYDADDFNQDIGNWVVSSVTNMGATFGNAKAFNQDIGGWNVSNVSNMGSMFYGAAIFNQDVSSWIVDSVTNMSGMFNLSEKFNQNIGSWEVSNVTDMSYMFKDAYDFNQDIGNWDISSVTDLEDMFSYAIDFNQNLGNWNITNSPDLSGLLDFTALSIVNYDSTLIGWAAQAVPSNLQLGAEGLEYCESQNTRDSLINFHGWTINGDSNDCPFITTWQTDNPGPSNNNQITIPGTGTYNVQWEKVDSTQINGSATLTGTATLTFPSAGIYRVSISGGLTQIRFNNSGDKQKILTIENWGPIAWTSMNAAFEGCTKLTYNATDAPDLSMVTDCSAMFQNCSVFNGAIGNWEVSNVSNMSGMFEAAYLFNQDINSWIVSNVTDMSGMFNVAEDFNMPIGNWNVSNVTDMSYMFQDATAFNKNISLWDVSSVTNMEGMFGYAENFNQDIGNWTVTDVTNMGGMFVAVDSFNQDISSWIVSNVTDMNGMFFNASSFNQDINSWTVSNVTNMQNMFRGATAFNQDLSNWNTYNVTTMESMFENASTFNQNIGSWNISGVTNMDKMLNNTSLSIANYDNTLTAWASQAVQSSVIFGADGLEYCNGETARNTLLGNSWTISGDTKNCQGISIAPKILLEGALFNGSDIPGTMNDDLRSSNLIPSTSPYPDSLSCNSSVFNTTGADAIVDWVYLELRDSTDHSIIVASRSALLQRDGDVVDVDGVSTVTIEQSTGHYFLAVGHRNHLAIMSASFINFGSATTNYDFTNSLSAIYGGGNSVADLTEGYALFGGDVNDNSQVQNTDASALIPNLGSAGYSNFDADLNGQVQNTELNNLLTPNIGKGEQF